MHQRIVWKDLPKGTRTAIQARTGPIEHVCAVSEGTNSTLAAVLHTSNGAVFVKGMRTDHPNVVTQQREAAINPHVRTVTPALRWHLDDVAGWNVLGVDTKQREPDGTSLQPGAAARPASAPRPRPGQTPTPPDRGVHRKSSSHQREGPQRTQRGVPSRRTEVGSP